jgi:hypothetical protein
MRNHFVAFLPSTTRGAGTGPAQAPETRRAGGMGVHCVGAILIQSERLLLGRRALQDPNPTAASGLPRQLMNMPIDGLSESALEP